MKFSGSEREIEKCIERLRAFDSDPKINQKKKLCSDMLEVIQSDLEGYDKLCTVGQRNWNDTLVICIKQNAVDLDNVGRLTIALAALAREYNLKSGIALRGGASAILEHVMPNNPELTSREQELANYIWNGLSVDVVRDLISQHFAVQNEHENKVGKWEKSLGEWASRVERHEESLKNFHQRYNFVTLAKAFGEMYDAKNTEKNGLALLLVLAGIALVAPILAQLPIGKEIAWLAGFQVNWTTADWPKVLPLVGLEVLTLYFFRIVLVNYNSVKTQLLQLDLRQALCAFIESYVEFAKGKVPGSKDANPLAKFEALVFSGLSPDPEKVPSSFDGLDQLVKMAKEFKSDK